MLCMRFESSEGYLGPEQINANIPHYEAVNETLNYYFLLTTMIILLDLMT